MFLEGFGGAGWLALTVDFLESELLCLTHEAEDHEPGDQVQASVEADCENVSMLMYTE